MVIAALVAFALLLLAWILAPTDGPRPAEDATPTALDLEPLAEAA